MGRNLPLPKGFEKPTMPSMPMGGGDMLPVMKKKTAKNMVSKSSKKGEGKADMKKDKKMGTKEMPN